MFKVERKTDFKKNVNKCLSSSLISVHLDSVLLQLFIASPASGSSYFLLPRCLLKEVLIPTSVCFKICSHAFMLWKW